MGLRVLDGNKNAKISWYYLCSNCAHLSANSSADQLMDHLHTGVDYKKIISVHSVYIFHIQNVALYNMLLFAVRKYVL